MSQSAGLKTCIKKWASTPYSWNTQYSSVGPG